MSRSYQVSLTFEVTDRNEISKYSTFSRWVIPKQIKASDHGLQPQKAYNKLISATANTSAKRFLKVSAKGTHILNFYQEFKAPNSFENLRSTQAIRTFHTGWGCGGWGLCRRWFRWECLNDGQSWKKALKRTSEVNLDGHWERWHDDLP